MPDKDFEKKVHEKMDEFQLSPSPEAWSVVEYRISREKKRRFIIFWFLVFLVATGAGSLFLINSGEKQNKLTVQTQQDQKIIHNSSEQNSSPIQQQKNSESGLLNQNQQPDNKNQVQDNPGIIIAEKFKAPDNRRKPGDSNRKSNESVKKETSYVSPAKPGDDEEKIKPKTESIRQEKNLDKKADSQPPNTNILVQVKPEKVSEQKPVSETEPVQNPPSVPTMSRDKKHKPVDWKLGLSVGQSTLVKQFHLFEKNLYSDLIALTSQLSSAPSGYYYSSIKPSFSLSAELNIRRKISKDLTLSGGFNYQFLSAKMPIGNRIDSTRIISNYYSPGVTVNSFYRPSSTGSKNNYIDQFHFLGLSGDLSWRVTHGKKGGIEWSNGLSYERLIASNMLFYDYSLKAFYKDNRRLQKNQVFFRTSIDIPVTKKISVSPFAGFSITRVLRRDDTLSRHYSNYGIRLNISLQKK